MFEQEHSEQLALHSVPFTSAAVAPHPAGLDTCCLYYTTFGLSAVCVYEEIAVIKVPTLQGAPQVRISHEVFGCTLINGTMCKTRLFGEE